MSFGFNSNINNSPQFKSQSSYKDGSGMGGGGMYFQQEGEQQKKKEEPKEDVFEFQNGKDKESEENNTDENTIVGKFMKWLRSDK